VNPRAPGLAGDWKPLSAAQVAGLAIACLILLAFHGLSESGWVPLVDNANLALHEAGHPLIGLFSGRLMVYGGTLFQLLFPLLVIRHFKQQREVLGVAAGRLWLGENLLNIARYMADARAQLLPLVGGGEHDWTEIFTRWGLLTRDVKVAGLTRWFGVLLMLNAVYWLWQQWQAQEKGHNEHA
jgi:hypothetical protein